MNIDKIIYDTTREVFNVEDKLKIASIFLFCEKLGNMHFSELLYTDNNEAFIDRLQEEYSGYEVDLSVNFRNPNVKIAFEKTREKVIELHDKSGYLKALYEHDEFALAIEGIVNHKSFNI